MLLNSVVAAVSSAFDSSRTTSEPVRFHDDLSIRVSQRLQAVPTEHGSAHGHCSQAEATLEQYSQVKDSAMLSKMQAMVSTSRPLGTTVAQIKDRLTAFNR